MTKRKQEARHHPNDRGKVVLMAEAEGFVMIRRPLAQPRCMEAAKWRKWKIYDPAKDPMA